MPDRLVGHAVRPRAQHLLLREQVRLFEKELAAVVAEQWKGCSATVMCVLGDRRAISLSGCQVAAACGSPSVEVGDSMVPLSALGFDERNTDGSQSIGSRTVCLS